MGADRLRAPVRGLRARGYKQDRRYLQHGLAVMPGVISAETGRLSAFVPTPRSSSGLLITTPLGRLWYKQAGQTDKRADMQADGPNRAKIVRGAILAGDCNTSYNSLYH